MILLGILLLIIGYFFARPLVWVGLLLVVIGLVLDVTAVPSPGGHWY